MHEGRWEYSGGLEEGIQRYMSREYDGMEEFFKPYVNDVLKTVKYLRDDHGDGRLFKMFEDTVLALVVKNYLEYDYVVGNPPYVNIKNIPESKQGWYKELYESAYGRFDLYVLFLERGLSWLKEDGKLGYITSNKFTRSRYGKKIRQIITSRYSLSEYVEFGDINIFSDATNFASILIIDRDEDREQVPYAKVHEAEETVFDDIRRHLGNENILTDSLEISTYPLSDLSEENWRFTPQPVREVQNRIQKRAARNLEDVVLGVREGVASGGDKSFMLSPEYAEEQDLEEELLWPIIRGKHVRRWVVNWDNELVIYPYDENGNLVELEQYPNIKKHLDKHREDLEDRYCVRKANKEIYEYHGPHPKSMFEGDFKIATPDMATENHFSFTDGFDCFKNTAYVLTFNESIPYSQKELLGLLNSSLAELTIKQTSPPLRGKPFRYRYKSQYVNKIPLPREVDDLEQIVDQIIKIEKIEQKIRSFPESYIENPRMDVSYVDYEWQTKRNPVEGSIQQLTDGRFAVTAGRSDKITDPLIDTGDEEERRFRAKYIHAAVDGSSVKSGEAVSIPIPLNLSDIETVLKKLKKDKLTVKNTNFEALESEIDEIVYDLFGLTEGEQDIIEEYLEIF